MAIACGAAIIPIVAMFIITDILEDRLQDCMKGEVRSLIESHVSQLTADLYEECRTSDQLLTAETKRAAMALQSLLDDEGRVQVLKRVSDWPVNNHRSKDTDELTVPVLTVGAMNLPIQSAKGSRCPCWWRQPVFPVLTVQFSKIESRRGYARSRHHRSWQRI